MLRALRRNLPLPREHGAWAMVLAPAVVGLAAGSVSAWQWLALLVALLGAFMTQDALVQRLTRQRSAPGWGAVAGATTVAALGGVPLLLAGHWQLLWLVAAAFAYLAIHVGRIRTAGRRGHRQLAFETLTVAMLCTSGVAGAMVAGSSVSQGAWVWASSVVMFVGSTFHVRALLRARQGRKHGPLRPWWLARESLGWHAAVAIGLIVATGVGRSPWLWLAFGPLVLRAFATPLVVSRTDPSLKAAGLGELGFTLLWVAGSLGGVMP